MSLDALKLFVTGSGHGGNEFKVLFAVAWCTHPKSGWASPGAEALAKVAQIGDPRTVRRVLAKLLKLGELECRPSRGRHPSGYRLVAATLASEPELNPGAGARVVEPPNPGMAASDSAADEPWQGQSQTLANPASNLGAGATHKVFKANKGNTVRARPRSATAIGEVLAIACGAAEQPDQKIDQLRTANFRTRQQPNSQARQVMRQSVPPRGADTEPPERFALVKAQLGGLPPQSLCEVTLDPRTSATGTAEQGETSTAADGAGAAEDRMRLDSLRREVLLAAGWTHEDIDRLPPIFARTPTAMTHR